MEACLDGEKEGQLGGGHWVLVYQILVKVRNAVQEGRSTKEPA